MSEIIRKGERVVLSQGEYSDYGIVAIAEAVEDFSPALAMKEFRIWVASNDGQCDELDQDDKFQFIAWIVNVRRLLVEVPVNWIEWHFGDYYKAGAEPYEIGPWRDAESDLPYAWDDARRLVGES